MPHLLLLRRHRRNDCAATRHTTCAAARVRLPRCRGVPRSPRERTALILCVLWRRLSDSYRCFCPRGALPFIAPHRQHSDVVASAEWPLASFVSSSMSSLSSSSPQPSSQDWPPVALDVCASAAESLITRLYLSTDVLDGVCWLVAFCLLDKLHLSHFVRHRLGQVQAVTLSLSDDTLPECLMALFCVACKWHMDCRVTVSYLLDLLALPRAASRAAALRGTLHNERLLLHCLGYHAAVSLDRVEALLHQFLAPAELQCVVHTLQPRSTSAPMHAQG